MNNKLIIQRLTKHTGPQSLYTYLRNCICASVLLAICTHSHAGFYLGVEGGANMMRGSASYTDNNNGQKEISIKSFGPSYGGFMGYLYQMSQSKIFLFGEGLYLKDSGKSKSATLTYPTLNDTGSTAGNGKGTLNVTLSKSFGGAIGGGMFFNPKVGFYVRIGLESMSLTTNYTLPGSTAIVDGKQKSAFMITPGAGLLYKTASGFGLGFEYNYMIGKKFTVRSATNAANIYTPSISFTPTMHRILLRASYMF